MFQIDNSNGNTVASSMPTLSAAATAGWFSNGNPTIGIQATVLTQDFMNQLQAELLAVLTAGGITPSKTVNNQLQQSIAAQIGQSSGMLYGLQLSNDAGTPNTKVDISIGAASAREIGTGVINVTSPLILDCTTVGANGLDTGSLAASTCYHVFAIGKPGSTAAFASTSLTPTLPATYTQARRIGSVITDSSSHILGFSQFGDEFLLNSPVNNVTTSALGTTATTYTLTVPVGVRVNALIRASGSAAALWMLLLTPMDVAAEVPNTPTGNVSLTGPTSVTSASNFNIRTNTSAQIRAVSSVASTSMYVTTYGWQDTRGRVA